MRSIHAPAPSGFERKPTGNEHRMKASWTYEVPPAGADAAGLEDYLVETRDGEAAGKVVAMLERDGERFLLFDSGAPPLAKERRAARWEDIVEIDHDTLTVTLHIRLDDALEVDPAKEIEDGDAEAVRVTDLPPSLTTPAVPERGPTDRPTYAGAIILFALGLIGLLALALAASVDEFSWEFVLFIVPVILIAAAGLAAYRAWREPYERSPRNS
jgi:hypothetical protein